jgi:aquaporin Z
MREAMRKHWPEYLMEAAGLGIFMISAATFGVVFEHPDSPVRQAIADPFVRRLLMGLVMGTTAICIIFSPWGKQSGAHLNPSVTLTFLRLGRVKQWDAFFYIVAQFVGGICGIFLAGLFLRDSLVHPSVNFVATLPGPGGPLVAFVAEFVIAFILMTVVLIVSNAQALARYTGLFAGALVAVYITFEAPLSGMSMNPARTLGSALPAQVWTSLWIYFTAPPLAMLAASEVYLRTRGIEAVFCAKLHHHNTKRCIFCEERAANQLKRQDRTVRGST